VAQGEQTAALTLTSSPLIRYDFTSIGSAPVTYFMQIQRGGVIKAGASTQLHDCYCALQLANPAPLEIIGVIRHADNVTAQEHVAVLQQRFRRWRIHGDWYRPAQAIFNYVMKNAEPVLLDTRPVRRRDARAPDVDAVADESSAELPLGLAKPNEVAERLGISIVTVRRWTRSGLLPHYQIGRAIIRYDLAEVIETIGEATGTVGAAQPHDLTLQAVQIVAETLGVAQESVRRYTDLFLQALGRLKALPDEADVGHPHLDEQLPGDSRLPLHPGTK